MAAKHDAMLPQAMRVATVDEKGEAWMSMPWRLGAAMMLWSCMGACMPAAAADGALSMQQLAPGMFVHLGGT
jgi:hypothetical protein